MGPSVSKVYLRRLSACVSSSMQDYCSSCSTHPPDSTNKVVSVASLQRLGLRLQQHAGLLQQLQHPSRCLDFFWCCLVSQRRLSMCLQQTAGLM